MELRPGMIFYKCIVRVWWDVIRDLSMGVHKLSTKISNLDNPIIFDFVR